MQWIATCPHETVEVLAAELGALGIKDQNKLHRGIAFNADLEMAYRAHLLLRTASRIQRVVAEFAAPDIHTLRTELQKIMWPDWLRSHRPFTVEPALTDPQAQGLGEEKVIASVVQSVQKGAFEKSAPRFDPEADNPISLVLFIRNEKCVIGIDTAGRALHKRGWRMTGHPAVLKETLAASILLLAGYTGEESLLDPMCGSGTIVIEAAYIALNKAPLIHRGKDDFALEHLAGFDRTLWRRVSDQLRAAKKSELRAPIYASDINAKYVELARASALRARVEKYLEFSVKPFQQWEPPTPTGLLVANLPYGERIGAGVINALYREVGTLIQQRFSNWRIALLVPNNAPIHQLALKTDQEIELMNGALPVKLLLTVPRYFLPSHFENKSKN
jgi:putative N6-adenine-specific DNA methylase